MSRFFSRLPTRITMAFTFVFLLIALGVILYWQYMFSPAILKGEQAKADLLSQSYAPTLAMALEAEDESRLLSLVNEVITLRDPETNSPMVLRLEVKPLGGKPVVRPDRPRTRNDPLYVVETPLFSQSGHNLLGTLRLTYNSNLYSHLIRDSRRSLLWGIAASLTFLLVVQILLQFLFRPLDRLAQNLEVIDLDKLKSLPPPEDGASSEIRQVSRAVNDLLERLERAKLKEEEQRQLHHEAELKNIKVDAELERVASLRAAKEHTENIVATVPSILMILDARLGFLSANTAFHKYRALMPRLTAQSFISPLEHEILAVIKSGQPVFQEISIASGGADVLTFDASVSQVKLEDGSAGILLTLTDITQRKRAEAELINKEKLLQAEAEATKMLLTKANYRHATQSALSALGKAMYVDWAAIFEYHYSRSLKTTLLSERFEWRRDRSTGPSGVSLFQDVPAALPLGRWVEQFSAGKSVSGPVRKLPAHEQEFLKPLGLQDFLAVPLTLEGKLWGFIAVGDCLAARSPSWSKAEKATLATLAGSVSSAIRRQQMEEQIKHQAYHDFLTGLPNRLLMTEHMGRILAHSQRHRLKFAVLFVDLDNFKEVNDRFGHDVGDNVLKGLAKKIAASVRRGDVAARFAGDEMTLLLPQIKSPADAVSVARKIMSIFQKPIPIDRHKIQITASIGISIYPEDGRDAETLLKNADIAMYYAKEQGRNNFQFHSALLGRRALRT